MQKNVRYLKFANYRLQTIYTYMALLVFTKTSLILVSFNVQRLQPYEARFPHSIFSKWVVILGNYFLIIFKKKHNIGTKTNDLIIILS